MKPFPNAKVALELLQSGDRNYFITHEIEVARYISECFDSSEPYLLNLCFHLSRFAVVEDEVYTFSVVADMIIEEYLDPEHRQDDILDFLQQDLTDRVCSPFWHLLARGPYRFSNDFKHSLSRYFRFDPCYFAEVMERTQDSYYIQVLENKLKELSPYVKYMPRFEKSHESIWEHDFWLRGGSSYIRLVEAEGTKIPTLPMDHLQTVFLDVLPDTQDEWFQFCTTEEKSAFQKRYLQFVSIE